MRTILVIWAAMGLSLGQAAASAEIGEPDIAAPPGQTKVTVGVYLIDLIEVDGASQTFTADLWFKLSWNDPRLAKPGSGLRRMDRADVWYPKLLPSNQRSGDPKWPDEVLVDDEGTVVYRQRSVSTFACPLDLRKFPHDVQSLHALVLGVESTPEDLVFEVDEAGSGRSKSFTITDWEAGEFRLSSGTHQVAGVGIEVPSFRIDFKVTRLSRYYLGTIFSTVAIIALMAWLVYWLPVGTLPPRVSVSVTSMLALIAYRFVAAQDLPKLPYLTSMDFFLLGAAVLILVGLTTVVVVANQDGKGNTQLAKRLNLVFRWAYPLVLLALLTAFATS